ncbi:MAG: hypothetical protein V7K53_18415 [Nostoc sp.]
MTIVDIADYNQALKINPNLAEAYPNWVYNILPNRNFNFSFADFERVGFIFI